MNPAATDVRTLLVELGVVTEGYPCFVNFCPEGTRKAVIVYDRFPMPSEYTYDVGQEDGEPPCHRNQLLYVCIAETHEQAYNDAAVLRDKFLAQGEWTAVGPESAESTVYHAFWPVGDAVPVSEADSLTGLSTRSQGTFAVGVSLYLTRQKA